MSPVWRVGTGTRQVRVSSGTRRWSLLKDAGARWSIPVDRWRALKDADAGGGVC